MTEVTLAQIVSTVNELKTMHNVKLAVVKAHGVKLDVLLATLAYLNETRATGHTVAFKLESDIQWAAHFVKTTEAQLKKAQQDLASLLAKQKTI